MKQLYPENFVPLLVIGEQEGYLMVYTAESNEETRKLLEDALYILDNEPEELLTKH